MKDIIDNLPQIISYFVPGAIYIGIFNFISNNKNESYEHYIFKSAILSYILNYVSKILFNIISKFHIENKLVFFTIFISIILAYFLALFYRSSLFTKILKFLHIYRNVKTNFWNDVFDYKNGNYIAVYLKEEELVYYGYLVKHDENNDKCFIMLKNYTVYDYEGNIAERNNDVNETVVLFLDESSRIEIKYSPDHKE